MIHIRKLHQKDPIYSFHKSHPLPGCQAQYIFLQVKHLGKTFTNDGHFATEVTLHTSRKMHEPRHTLHCVMPLFKRRY